ncbi:MAG: HD domain-containing protein [Alphaproteobacteria bacterium]|nr:HD domain-containing protein [Alphaproteobacteria bacterium]
MFQELLDLLLDLDGVRQDPRHHPEGDALFHSLQVFRHARRATRDRQLQAAALLHDVGKAHAGADHDVVGAELLEGLVPPRVCWLVAHHLDLLRAPRETRWRLRGDPRLRDLEDLRDWDLAGRDPRARVGAPVDALLVLYDDPRDLAVPSPTVGEPTHDPDEEPLW